jgi:flavin reductase (DIM6/NTAB) family NADH-FMN oxidoreductase RutF
MRGDQISSKPGAQPPGARAFRDMMGLFATGVTVVTTRVDDGIHGMTANSVAPVSLDPLLVIVSIARDARMYRVIHRAGTFAINILSEQQEALSRHFAGVDTGPPPTSLDLEWVPDGGAPFIRDALAGIHCRIEREVDVGDHVIVLGRVVELHQGAPLAPLIYFGGRYRSLREIDARDGSAG